MLRPVPAFRRALTTAITFVLLLASVPASAGEGGAPAEPWMFRTRLVLTGNSDHSEPAGFTVYSAVTLEAALCRRLSRRLTAELSLRTESREVDRAAAGGPDERLGSLELLPITLAIQYRPAGGGTVHPYAGFGVNMTTAWEKSGELDSLDVGPHLGPAVQLGADFDLGPRVVFNAHIGWNTLVMDIDRAGTRFARLKIDPIALGLGVGFRF